MRARRHGPVFGLAVLLPALSLTPLSACDRTEEAGVLVNVQLETTDLRVSELRLRGYAPNQESLVLEVTRARPDGELFGQTENIFVEVPRSWIGRIVWLGAEGWHEGAVTAHGSVSLLPRKNTVVEVTLVLVAGASPCGDGVVDPGEQCDGTDVGEHSCASLTGLRHGVPRCVDCLLDVAACHDCGNGEIEAGPESCDGDNLGGETCQSQGFVTGDLGCTPDCRLDRSACEQGCGNDRVDPGEACDGVDLGRFRCADLGFLWGHVGCTTDCTLDSSGCVGRCGDGVLDSLEDCDGTDFGEQTCQTRAGRTSGSLICTQGCHVDVADCHTCGDGIIEADEQCDGPSLGGATCQGLGFDGGTLACDASCQPDPTGCTSVPCGNGAIDAGEQCDGANLNGEDCLSLGFTGGTLGCDPSCGFNTAACVSPLPGCGNGYVSAAEECDDGNLLAGDGCDASCNTEPGYRCYDDPSTCVPDAAVLFVDCGLAGGGTGTLADPFSTIGDAVNSASNGQLLWILNSTCNEDVNISTVDVAISGDASVLWDAPSCPGLEVHGRQVLLWRMHLRSGLWATEVGASVTVKNSEIGPSSGCEAVYCNVDAHCELRRNYIHGNVDGGIWVLGASFRIVNNIIVDNGTPGSTFRGGVSLSAAGYSPTELVNNTIAFNAGRAAPFISGVRCVSAMEVRNNIVWMNSSPELSSNCDPWFNVVSDPTWHNVQGNLNLDPLFVNQPGGDYHIQPSSPAVDSADPTGIPPAPAADFDGESRFLGFGVDCGADEAS